MDPIAISSEPYSQELHEEIVSEVVAFNNVVAQPDNYEPLIVTARRDEKLVAGLTGATYFEWLFVSHFWVAKSERGSGLGSSILRAAEHQAVARDCHGVWLDTFSFQAKPFYEKQGYAQFGELPNYPNKHSRHFMYKRLDS